MVGNIFCGFTKRQKYCLVIYTSNLLSVVTENINSCLPLQNVIFFLTTEQVKFSPLFHKYLSRIYHTLGIVLCAEDESPCCRTCKLK